VIGKVFFKDWLPDQPELENPGLFDVHNMLPGDTAYRWAPSMETVGSGTINSNVKGAFEANGVTKGSVVTYAGDASGQLYRVALASVTTANPSSVSINSLSTDDYWSFAQYSDMVVAASRPNVPRRITIGQNNFTALAATGTAPSAGVVGVVGQFVVLGDLEDTSGTDRSHVIRWSSIGDPTDWPTPNSSTAVANQSGEQELQLYDGEVRAIYGSDQYGVVLQKGAITRMTYLGGTAVFQFDRIEQNVGSFFQRGSVQVGAFVYFISQEGFCRTNGTGVERIGAGKVDEYFWRNVNGSDSVICAYDPEHSLVWWGFSTAGVADQDTALIFNPRTGAWSKATVATQEIFTPATGQASAVRPTLRAVSASGIYSRFTGAPVTATAVTSETEWNVAGFSRVGGIKPLVDVTANAVTVALGTRNDRTSAVTFTAETTANARSGFADFRSEARYHRARLTIAGTFNACQGLEFEVVESGRV
jgi:hypothetical protein